MTEWSRLLFEFGANLALLVTLTFFYGWLLRIFEHLGGMSRSIIEGTLFGVIAVIGMQFPLHIAQGIIVDGRTAIVMLAAAFAGPVAGVVAGALVAGFRIYLGGVGVVAGVGAISTAVGVGLVYWYVSSSKRRKVTPTHLIAMALPMTVVSLLWVFALPEGVAALPILNKMLLPIGIMYPVTTLLLGLMLSQEQVRRQLVEQLLHSEKRLIEFSEVASDWLWEMDADLRFTFFSDRVEEVVGIPVAFHIGKTREELAGGDATTEKWQRHFADLRAHRPFRDFRYDRKGPNGQIQYLSSSGKPIFNNRGEFQGYVGIGSDLTHLIKSEEQVRHANETLAAAIEALSEPFVLWDAEDKLVIGNNRFREINKSAGKDLLPGTTYLQFAKSLLENDLVPEAAGREEEWLVERLEMHRNPAGPFEQLRPDGTWLMIYEQSLPGGGTATISSDVTHHKNTEKRLKESQEKFREFASAAADWFWEQDANLCFTQVSEDNVAITGMEAADHIGLTRRETNILDVTEEEMQAHEALLEARQPFSNFRFSRMKPDGKKVYISISGKPVFDENGVFAGYRGAGQDLTEMKEVNEKLRSAQRMEAIGQLTGGIAHDFNNLMAVMVGNAELLEHNIKSGEGTSANIEAIKSAALRGASLTHRLLAFSRQQPLSPIAANVGELISGLEEMFARTLGEAIDLQLHIPPDMWRARMDPHQFEDALLNLAINAKHAMPKGGTLQIETRNASLDETLEGMPGNIVAGDYVEVSVGDTGDGISSDALEKVFEPFFTTKDVGEGSGLGLSMVYGFVRQSEGYITVSSDPGEGTKFRFYLPRATDT